MAATASLPPGFGGLAMIRSHENPPTRLRRSRGKRVTWAAPDHLCKVRMFLAEDAPILAGVAQDQLQGKTSSFMHRTDDLPPGFGGGVVSCLKSDAEAVAAAVVAAIPWKTPQKINLEPSWHVEAGEGSNEVELQRQRESKTLEAVYPRSSAIPNSPLEAPIEPFDDRHILVIPVTAPDEDSDDGDENTAQANSTPSKSYGFNQQTGNDAPAIRNSVVSSAGTAAASSDESYCGGSVSAAAASALSRVAAASAIDPSLLLQLLANPSLVETLSGVRNISLVNRSNGNGSSVPPNQLVAGVKNLTSNSTSVTIAQNVSSGFSSDYPPPPPPPSSSVVAPLPRHHHHHHHPPGLASTAPAPTPASASIASSSVSSASASSSAPWVSHFQVQAPVSTSDDGYGVYGGFKNPSAVMQQQFQAQQQNQNHQQQQQQFLYANAQKLHRQQQQQASSQQRQQQQQQQQQAEVYYKELIVQHGNGNGGAMNQHGGFGNGFVDGAASFASAMGSRPRSARTCAYFNTPKGCRNGLKCPFVHDGGGGGKRGAADLTFQHQLQAKRMRG